MEMNKTFKGLADKVNETTTEIKQVTRDIELAMLVVNEQHHDRLRTRSSDKE